MQDMTTTTATAAAKLPRLSIYEIKRRYEEANAESGRGGYYFTRKTMRFFGQRLRDFRVTRNFGANTYSISAPRRPDGRYMGTTRATWDPNKPDEIRAEI